MNIYLVVKSNGDGGTLLVSGAFARKDMAETFAGPHLNVDLFVQEIEVNESMPASVAKGESNVRKKQN